MIKLRRSIKLSKSTWDAFSKMRSMNIQTGSNIFRSWNMNIIRWSMSLSITHQTNCVISFLLATSQISRYHLIWSSESAESLIEQFKNTRDDVRDSLIIAQKKQKKYSNTKLIPKVFQVDDLVCLKYNHFDPDYKSSSDHNHKLTSISTPIHILERLSSISYRLDLSEDSRIHDVISILHLKEFKDSDEDIRSLSVIIDDTEEWEVECIDGERVMSQGVTQYLVRWKGYDPDDRTWQTLKDLANAEISVLTWKASRAETPKPLRPITRRSPRKSVHQSKRSRQWRTTFRSFFSLILSFFSSLSSTFHRLRSLFNGGWLRRNHMRRKIGSQ